jgi:hypothetical protein
LFSFRNVLSGLCGVMCCFVQAQALQYRIAPVLDQPNPYLNVSVRYQPPVGDTETSFSYPNAHWGEQDLWNCLQALQANGQLFMERDSGRFTIKHPPGAAVEVTYRIQPDQFSPLVWERSFRPIVESGSFHVFGFALFAVPDKYWGNNASGAPVSFAWAGPANTPLAYVANVPPGGNGSDSFANRMPDVVDVSVRILTEKGADLIRGYESITQTVFAPPGVTPQAYWWEIARANSRVFTRRIVLRAEPL